MQYFIFFNNNFYEISKIYQYNLFASKKTFLLDLQGINFKGETLIFILYLPRH